jgi:hypothetical protein
MTDIATIVSTVGFPIASFLLSAWFIKYSYDRQIEQGKISDEREDRHWEEISKLTTAVNNNTEVLRDLTKQMMEVGKND